MSRFGVGVITVGRRPIRDYLLPDDCTFVVVTDTERRGVAWARNQVLQQLDHCEHIFLFDDDCWPVMRGWAEYWSAQCAPARVYHSALPEAFKSTPRTINGLPRGAREMIAWDGGIGAAIYQHRSALDVIGGYNEALHGYGFEDAGRADRAYRAGLTGPTRNACPLRCLAYIHSADVMGENPTPSYTVEEKEAHIAANRDAYLAELAGPVFMPYR
jgi:hypothetical protein